MMSNELGEHDEVRIPFATIESTKNATVIYSDVHHS